MKLKNILKDIEETLNKSKENLFVGCIENSLIIYYDKVKLYKIEVLEECNILFFKVTAYYFLDEMDINIMQEIIRGVKRLYYVDKQRK